MGGFQIGPVGDLEFCIPPSDLLADRADDHQTFLAVLGEPHLEPTGQNA